jgi:putative membrane protein
MSGAPILPHPDFVVGQRLYPKDAHMAHPYWNDWYFGWGWIGFIFLMFSGFGNWGYTYQAHRKYNGQPRSEPLDILNERYARGDISREDYGRLKTDIYGAVTS